MPSEQSPQRKKRGLGSTMIASGLIAIENMLRGKTREEVAEIREAAGTPGNIDRHGITVELDEGTTAHSPAPMARGGAKRLVVRRRTRQGN